MMGRVPVVPVERNAGRVSRPARSTGQHGRITRPVPRSDPVDGGQVRVLGEGLMIREEIDDRTAVGRHPAGGVEHVLDHVVLQRGPGQVRAGESLERGSLARLSSGGSSRSGQNHCWKNVRLRGVSPGIGHEPVDFAQVAVVGQKLATRGCAAQRRIGHRAPEVVRQARGQLPRVQPVGVCRQSADRRSRPGRGSAARPA